MLVLTRRIGERILLGDDVSIVILGFQGSQVRVGVEAPKRVPVHREEVYQRIKLERKQVLERSAAKKRELSEEKVEC